MATTSGKRKKTPAMAKTPEQAVTTASEELILDQQELASIPEDEIQQHLVEELMVYDRAGAIDKKHEQEIFEGVLEFIITHAGVKINAGTVGVVLELDLNKVHALIRNHFLSLFPHFQEEPETVYKSGKAATKVFKVYSRGKGLDEATLSGRAKEIIEGSDLADQVTVPTALYSGISLSDEQSIRFFEDLGVKVNRSKPRVDFLMMDMVDGMDLEIWSYREFIKIFADRFRGKCPDGDLDRFIDTCNRDRLIDLIFSEFGQRDSDQFDELIVDALSGRGLFDREKFEVIKKTLELLHQNGFYHRDLHQGNVMISSSGKVVFIDFDRSICFEPGTFDHDNEQEIRSKVYDKSADKNRRYRNDSWILGFLEPMTRTAGDLLEEELAVALSMMKTIRRKAESNDVRIKRAWDNMQVGLDSGLDVNVASDNFIREINGSPTNLPTDYAIKIAVLMELYERGRQAEVVSVVQEIIAKNSSAVVIKKFNAFLKYLG